MEWTRWELEAQQVRTLKLIELVMFVVKSILACPFLFASSLFACMTKPSNQGFLLYNGWSYGTLVKNCLT